MMIQEIMDTPELLEQTAENEKTLLRSGEQPLINPET
jgi:hypothetical protein